MYSPAEINDWLTRLEVVLQPCADYKEHSFNLLCEIDIKDLPRRMIPLVDGTRDHEIAVGAVRAHLKRKSEDLLNWDPQSPELKKCSVEFGQRARRLLDLLRVDFLVDIIPTIDFTLELRRREVLASQTENQTVYFCLISVAGFDDQLKRENHDAKGYHFHHVDAKDRRTNVLLTFDPKEPVGSPDSLYWEEHGGGLTADPSKWGERRRIAMHTATVPSTRKPGKAHFLPPSKSSVILCAR